MQRPCTSRTIRAGGAGNAAAREAASSARSRPFRFFADLGKGNPTSFDEVDLDDLTAVMGRLFFKIPGKIQPGQYWLVVKLQGSEVQVPFRIFTKEEEKEFKKKWQDIKKAFEAELEG